MQVIWSHYLALKKRLSHLDQFIKKKIEHFAPNGQSHISKLLSKNKNNPHMFRIFIYLFLLYGFVQVKWPNSKNLTVDIEILWCIHNRLIVHDKIFVIKLISNWWREWSANEIKPRGNIKWRKLYGNVRRKDLYGKFLLNEIPN